ncbi:hypothetical protein ACFY12_14735 [Streptomyces sp. NPDC001339]|uniref:hypothetical protein n=1 Tax=Streptomyces sp. NPDC001339 TaxID=3364563 RepID=UPI0036A877E3
MARKFARNYGSAAAAVMAALLGTSACAAPPQRDATPDELSAKAVNSIRAASSVRVRMAQTGPEAMDIDLTMSRGGKCAGRIVSGEGTAHVIKVGKEFWLKPDDKFWKAQFGGGSEATALVKGRYLHGSTQDEQIRDIAAMCDLAGIHKTLAGEVGAGPFTKSAPVTVDGRRAETVSGKNGAVLISVVGSGAPELIRIVQKNEHTVTATFTDWEKPVRASAPAAGQSVDLARLS